MFKNLNKIQNKQKINQNYGETNRKCIKILEKYRTNRKYIRIREKYRTIFYRKNPISRTSNIIQLDMKPIFPTGNFISHKQGISPHLGRFPAANKKTKTFESNATYLQKCDHNPRVAGLHGYRADGGGGRGWTTATGHPQQIV